jgi:hypothetical protein
MEVAMPNRLTRRQVAAIMMGGFSGFVLGMAAYILLEMMLS